MDDISKADWSEDLHQRDENGRFMGNAQLALNELRDNVATRGDLSEEQRAEANSHIEDAQNKLTQARHDNSRGDTEQAAASIAGASVAAANAEEVTGDREVYHVSGRTGQELSSNSTPAHIGSQGIAAAFKDYHNANNVTTVEHSGPAIGLAGESMKKSSVAKASKAVKHKAKAAHKDVEGLISPVLKELEGRVAVLESSTPSDVLAHSESVLDAGVVGEMSLRKQADMAASAVTKEELLEQARIAALEEFSKMTNPN